MDYRQRSEESVDDLVTRPRTQTLKCGFEPVCTSIEAVQRELLGKAKGCKLTDANRFEIAFWDFEKFLARESESE